MARKPKWTRRDFLDTSTAKIHLERINSALRTVASLAESWADGGSIGGTHGERLARAVVNLKAHQLDLVESELSMLSQYSRGYNG